MEDYNNFVPNSEEEKQWVEQYNNLSKFISSKLRGLNEQDRLTVLRELNMSDLSLMNLYLQALKQEDYETCSVSKILLIEKGFKIPS